MVVAVSGSSGHIGANLINLLVNKGFTVKALFRDDTRAAIPGIQVIKGDVFDIQSIENLVRDAEVVFHLAARISIADKKDPLVWQTNVEGTRNILEASLKYKVRKFIHFSSIHAFNSHPLDEVLDETRSLANAAAHQYDRSKAAGEMLVKEAAGRGMETVILNPTSVVGPGDFKPSFSGQFLVKLCSGRLPVLVGGGFDWVDARDICDAALQAIDKGRSGEKYLLSAYWLTVKDIARMTAEIAGIKSPAFVCPHYLALAGLPFLNLFAKLNGHDALYTRTSLNVLREAHSSISNQKARKELGFSPRDFSETLRDTIQWFNENAYLKNNVVQY
jgi:dihydroflavonol-4-reductase